MDRYMGGEDIDTTLLIDDLETAVARGSFFPVVPVCALTGLGLDELLEIITSAFPSPSEHTFPAVYTAAGKTVDDLACDPAGPLVAEVVKTTSDPYVGRISLTRVFSGTVTPDATVHVSGSLLRVQRRRPRPRGPRRGRADRRAVVPAREGAAASRLSASPATSARSPSCPAPRPATRSATRTTRWSWSRGRCPTRCCRSRWWRTPRPTRTSSARRLPGWPPRTRPSGSSTTPRPASWCSWCMGEAHADVLLDRLRTGSVSRSTRSTSGSRCGRRSPARRTAKGRHVKQSGGHGQYAVCDIAVEPLGRGGGFEFVDKVVGGSVPAPVHPERREGRPRPARARPVGRLPGRRHPGDAVRRQGAQRRLQRHGVPDGRLRGAAGGGQSAGVRLLEPIDSVDILIDDEFVGAVMGDLSTRRARVLGTEPVGTGRTLVKAEAPQLELIRYATELRSLSHGTGTFSRDFVRYEPLPGACRRQAGRGVLTQSSVRRSPDVPRGPRLRRPARRLQRSRQSAERAGRDPRRPGRTTATTVDVCDLVPAATAIAAPRPVAPGGRPGGRTRPRDDGRVRPRRPVRRAAGHGQPGARPDRPATCSTMPYGDRAGGQPRPPSTSSAMRRTCGPRAPSG